ncbi:MAG TPA: DUF998 domain-containing protein [Micromonosporaceae bacterium]|nr:DUF998 domain-containing protein [Micromonosporaceae bacterium]HCU52295.1 DUF998 domain-containing protein [Micromonosporaceae bacterium]
MSPETHARPLATTGLVAALAGVLAVVVLHLLPPTDQISPIRRTISEYALHETAWLFNLGLLSLAVGSFAVLLALSRAGLVRLISVGGAGLLLWCLGLAAVVYFPKHNWAVGPSANGSIHRVASLVAFIGLPLGALAIAWAWRRDQRWQAWAKWTAVSAAVALLCFGIIAGAVVLQPVTGVRWWRAIPLGAVERALATAEVVTVLALGWWAGKAAKGQRAG